MSSFWPKKVVIKSMGSVNTHHRDRLDRRDDARHGSRREHFEYVQKWPGRFVAAPVSIATRTGSGVIGAATAFLAACSWLNGRPPL